VDRFVISRDMQCAMLDQEVHVSCASVSQSCITGLLSGCVLRRGAHSACACDVPASLPCSQKPVIVPIKVKKVKFSLCLSKHYAMKTYWGVEV
jgi:hypothetical protein